MVDYGGTGEGDFIKGVGLYKPDLDKVVKANEVWMSHTKYYRKYIYDKEQTEEEERLELEQKKKEHEEELIKEKKELEKSNMLDNDILELLQKFDR
jgi:hypothetical protein